jgi:hypothetical protein
MTAKDPAMTGDREFFRDLNKTNAPQAVLPR